ncbi:MAG: c-type cytochrome [Planctomycetaceae bacterium]
MPDSPAFPYYPINDFGPLMKGMVMGALGVFHVFLAQFAIGGGLLLCYLEWLSQHGHSPHARRFVDGFFKWLVLISFVVGALTGVGMWFTSIQLSPRTIGLMVSEFHWIWATEWTFFCLEIVAGYAFYRYGERLDGPSRLRLLVLYALAAWFSLFWINGILSWQLTPGAWVETRSVWSGFFNAGFWPSLVFRTVTSMTIAALVACVVINLMGTHDREARAGLMHHVARFLAPMVLMPALGIWYFATVPADSRRWVLGGSAAMTMFFMLGAGTSLLIGLYAVFGLLQRRLYVNAATAMLLCALALGATAGGEFVREGVRKPYTIRETLLSNSIRPAELARLRERGSVTDDPYPLRDAERLPNDQLRLGAKVYRFQCSICHTLDGANALVDLAGSWSDDQKRTNIAQLQRTKTFMPPFAGNALECEALVQFIAWTTAGSPANWPVSDDPEALKRIDRWLNDAGTAPLVQRARPTDRESL